MGKKLPVLATLVTAIALCREHLPYALKIIAPWFVILTIARYLVYGPDTEILDEMSGLMDLSPDLLLMLLSSVGWTSIAVLWHWRILRDDSQSGAIVTFDRRIRLYILRGLLIMLVAVAIGSLTFILYGLGVYALQPDFMKSVNVSVLLIVMMIPGIIIAIRLCVALPAIALNMPTIGLRDVWTATKGNSFRLFIVMVLPFLPFIPLYLGLDAVGFAETNLYRLSPGYILLNLIFHGLDFGLSMIALTVLSLAFAFFMENRAVGDYQQPPEGEDEPALP